MITKKLYMNLYSPALKEIKNSLEELKERDPDNFKGFQEELDMVNDILTSFYT